MSALSLTVITTSVSLVSYSSYYFCQPCLLSSYYLCQPCLLLLLLYLSDLSLTVITTSALSPPPFTTYVSLVSYSSYLLLSALSLTVITTSVSLVSSSYCFCQPCLLLPLLLFLFFLLFLLFTSTSAFTLPHTSVNLFPPPPFTFDTCSAELKEED